jgi:putative transposase
VSGGLTWGVEPICDVLQFAPSTYYATKSRPLSARALRDAELRPKLRAIWEANYEVYGRRKLHRAARRAGLEIGRDQCARLMRAEGLIGVRRAKKRITTRRDPTHVRAPDLVHRQFVADAPDRLWVGDLERHEALLNPAVVKGHRHVLVAAGALKLRAA